MSIISIYSTFPDQPNAIAITKLLVEKKLIACSNIFPIQSIYKWENKIEQEGEFAAIMKSSEHLWLHIIKTIEDNHPYKVPCIVKSKVETNTAYANWINETVNGRTNE